MVVDHPKSGYLQATRSWRKWFFVIGTIAVAGTIGFRVAPARKGADQASAARHRLRELAASMGGTSYQTGPRLVGFGRVSPGKTPVAPDRLPATARIAIAQIEKLWTGTDDPETEHAWGVTKLLAGDFEGAVVALESAARDALHDPVILSDAAAAMVEAARGGSENLWIRALELTERARRLQPDLMENLFNRALALEGLHLTDEASRAWAQYLDIDSVSAWAAEARTRQANLRMHERGNVAWLALKDQLRSQLPNLQNVPPQSVKPVRQQLRLWIERELLPKWGEAILAGNHAAAENALSNAHAAAQLLARAGGDAMPSAATDVVRTRTKDVHGKLADLARSHVGLPVALSLFEEGRVADAVTAFDAAAGGLEQAGSPYRAWGSILRTIPLYTARQLGPARQMLQSAAGVATSFGYLQGRVAWLEGLIALNEGDLSAALQRYRAAAERFEALGETDAAAAISALISENQGSLGNFKEAWRHQRAGLAYLPRVTVARRRQLIVQHAVLLSLKEDLPHAALVFQEEALKIASEIGKRPISMTDGYLHRARIHTRIGDMASADMDLAKARAAASAIDPADVRRRQEAEIDAAAAEVYRTGRQPEAIAAADRAVAFFDDRAGQVRLSRLLLLRGRAHLAAGHHDEAERDLAAAVTQFERVRDRVVESSLRRLVFQDGWAASSELIAFELRHRRNARRGLEIAERARARTLLESLDPDAVLPTLETALASLPPRTTAMFFAALSDELWLWVATRDSVELLKLDIRARDLQRQVERLTRGMQQGSDAGAGVPTSALLQRLHDALIAPARSLLAATDTLVIVPDGALHALPFAALIDRADGRFLIEKHVVVIAPSLCVFSRSQSIESGGTAPRALIVGDPFTASDAAGLPFARQEVERLNGMYPDRIGLTGMQATKQAFLRELPGADVVHYAGHARVDVHEPDRSHLLLAGQEGQTPLFVTDLASAALPRHPIVVLAACSTNAGRVAGQEGMLSLARPFLGAGARAVVATLWDIQDRASAEFFVVLHSKISRGLPAARAVAETQRQLLRDADPSVRTPSRWAWAVAIGGS
jgi:CHAT domain-containing protein